MIVFAFVVALVVSSGGDGDGVIVTAAFSPSGQLLPFVSHHHALRSTSSPSSVVLLSEKGAGGMFDTRNPDAFEHDDARKSINKAPSFEEYMKMRGSTSAAPAPDPAAPPPAAAVASPPVPAPAASSTGEVVEKGAGGMFDTRNPDTFKHEDTLKEAPSFEEYMKMRGSTSTTPAPAPVSAAAAAAVTSPITPAPAAATTKATTTTASSTDIDDPIATLDASQSAIVTKIAASIPDLAIKPDLSWSPNDGVNIGGLVPVTLDARDAPGPANVAWLCSTCIPSKLSSLTIFNGPLTNVPHLLSRCCVMDNVQLRLDLDFRPRSYGAYEMIKPDGTYPGPEELGRKAFEYSGARMDFDKFGNDEVKAFLDQAKVTFEGAVDNTDASALDALTGGPVAMSLTMPATSVNVAAINKVREQAAEAWLRWAAMEGNEHEHRPGAPINTQYVYDAKFRQNAYSALLPFYSSLFGAEDGAKLAAAESGPLDEAYVGGGS